MLDVIAAVNDELVLENNLLRSPLLQKAGIRLHLQRGYASASRAYSAAMRECRSELLVFAHQDVYLPAGWERHLLSSIARLGAIDPAWAVVGIYGARPNGHHVGCVWSSGLDSVFGTAFYDPVAVESIDEALIVLRRSSGVEFDPDLPGYHLYGTDIVQTALARGQGAYVVFAPVVHNSRPVLYLGRDYFQAYRYVASKWRERLPINSHVARLVKPGLEYCRLRIRNRIREWRYRHADRKSLDRNYDCVCLARRQGFE